ncbi:PPOX class F420-dependent oxidoreductase [Nocardia implantans]|uniref:PPOX class F420-dependent oxidoreductase n=1 Tax=Nocardia implantans TaxID=3108168 RepID=A0ABU6AV30_9NOCA|nr:MULTISPECIES: PPOX class F420-dependent oxidoreductase [unclassified Nocardia]MBF6192465.1 PPOX class F420-dependent oxidoreductase [Nocardia beijingensis]MEA3527630.1 PPOX class F420-dependent oxidoreductase [Nocardia sp. CDC192]MEB3511338.1 PPOX class F420-dependent oxidoreductase [Nocardia sp. CDC186]
MTWNEMSQSKYVRLTTFRKDGTPVGTPVWVAPDGDRIVVWTNAGAGKVKRIRRNPDVALQICDGRGRPTGQEVLAGSARILDAAGTQRVRDVVANKYGIIGKLAIRGHKLLRGADASVGIAIAPKAAGDPA